MVGSANAPASSITERKGLVYEEVHTFNRRNRGHAHRQHCRSEHSRGSAVGRRLVCAPRLLRLRLPTVLLRKLWLPTVLLRKLWLPSVLLQSSVLRRLLCSAVLLRLPELLPWLLRQSGLRVWLLPRLTNRSVRVLAVRLRSFFSRRASKRGARGRNSSFAQRWRSDSYDGRACCALMASCDITLIALRRQCDVIFWLSR